MRKRMFASLMVVSLIAFTQFYALEEGSVSDNSISGNDLGIGNGLIENDEDTSEDIVVTGSDSNDYVDIDYDYEIDKMVQEKSFSGKTGTDEYTFSTMISDSYTYAYIGDMYETADNMIEVKKEQERLHKEWVELNGSGMATIENVDPNYDGCIITLDPVNRDLLERLVMGEAGGEGLIGAGLVAQCIHDTMVKDGNYDVASIIANYRYTGGTDRAPNDTVKQAVNIVFDQGGYIVKHRVIYFYAPGLVQSSWHESQVFVIEYGGHRVFDKR